MKVEGKMEAPMFAFWATPERQAEIAAEKEREEAQGPDGNVEWVEALKELMQPQPYDKAVGDTAALIGQLARSGSVELPKRFTTTGPDGKTVVTPVKFSESGRATVKREIERLQGVYMDPAATDSDRKMADQQAKRWFKVLYPGATSGTAFIAESAGKDVNPGHTPSGSRAVGEVHRVNLTGKNYRPDDPRGKMLKGGDRHGN